MSLQATASKAHDAKGGSASALKVSLHLRHQNCTNLQRFYAQLGKRFLDWLRTCSSIATSVAAMLCGSSRCDSQVSCTVKTRGRYDSEHDTLFLAPQPPTSCSHGPEKTLECLLSTN